MRPIRAGAKATEVPTVWVRRKEGESSNPFRRNFKYVWKALAILFAPGHPTVASIRSGAAAQAGQVPQAGPAARTARP
jgi:hypothetical protein